MAAVSRPVSWWGALSVVLVGAGASLVACGALFGHHLRLVDAYGRSDRLRLEPLLTLGSVLALLAAGGVLVRGAWRPDRWAPWLTRLGAPALRVHLPLSLAFLALPLGAASVQLYAHEVTFTQARAVAGVALAVSLLLGVPLLLIMQRTRLMTALAAAALPLAAMLALLGVVVATQDSASSAPVSEGDSLRRLVGSFGPPRVLLEPSGSGAAGSRDSTDPVLDPSMVDTMVERPVRGAGERPVEVRRPDRPGRFEARRLDISQAQRPMTLDLACAKAGVGTQAPVRRPDLDLAYAPTDPACPFLEARLNSPDWKGEARRVPLNWSRTVELRQDGPGGRLLLSDGRGFWTIEPATGAVEDVSMDSFAMALRRQQPLPWRLAPLGALAALLALGTRRRAVMAWREALENGVRVRVRDGWVRGPGGFEAATGLRDGPAVLVEEVRQVVGYREASVLPEGVLVPGRQGALVERAQLNTRLLDATALLVAALAVAPVLAVRLAQVALDFAR